MKNSTLLMVGIVAVVSMLSAGLAAIPTTAVKHCSHIHYNGL